MKVGEENPDSTRYPRQHIVLILDHHGRSKKLSNQATGAVSNYPRNRNKPKAGDQ